MGNVPVANQIENIDGVVLQAGDHFPDCAPADADFHTRQALARLGQLCLRIDGCEPVIAEIARIRHDRQRLQASFGFQTHGTPIHAGQVA